MISWSDQFRRTPRNFSFNEETGILEVICQDTLYFNYNLGENNEILSIDPDSGPYLSVNGKLYCGTIVIVIDEILDYKHIKSTYEEETKEEEDEDTYKDENEEDEDDIYDLYITMRAHKL